MGWCGGRSTQASTCWTADGHDEPSMLSKGVQRHNRCNTVACFEREQPTFQNMPQGPKPSIYIQQHMQWGYAILCQRQRQQQQQQQQQFQQGHFKCQQLARHWEKFKARTSRVPISAVRLKRDSLPSLVAPQVALHALRSSSEEPGTPKGRLATLSPAGISHYEEMFSPMCRAMRVMVLPYHMQLEESLCMQILLVDRSDASQLCVAG